MKEASRAKFYLAKYFCLGFGLMQWLAAYLLVHESSQDKSKAAALLFFTIGLILISIQLVIAPRLKRVAVGKNRIAIIDDGETRHYEWSEVKWIKPLPIVNAYKLKIRGKKNRFYFLPSKQMDPVFGLSNEKPAQPEDLRGE